jgi:hypothetical protein
MRMQQARGGGADARSGAGNQDIVYGSCPRVRAERSLPES